MQTFLRVFGLSVLVFCVSCRHGNVNVDENVDTQVVKSSPSSSMVLSEEERLDLEKDVAKEIKRIHKLLMRGDLREAERVLKPLMVQPVFREEIKSLAAFIASEKKVDSKLLSLEETDLVARREVENRLRLPETYGKTVIISRETENVQLPQGPMEKLVNQNVSMHLENANVGKMILALSEIDGLNIIADKALTTAEDGPTLTIHVKDVPLKSILSYIARNMGIAFHVGENMVWVTESEEVNNTPVLETKIFKLRRGLIPRVSKSSGGNRNGGNEGGFGMSSSGGEGGDQELFDALDALFADSPDGSLFRFFPNRNLLIVKNSRDNLRLVEDVVKEFDREPAQVLVEARFLTISQDELLEIGTEFTEFATRNAREKSAVNSVSGSLVKVLSSDDDASDDNTGSTGGDADTNILTDFPFTSNEGLGLKLAGVLGNKQYEMIIRLLEEEGRSRTISAPRVTVLNNQPAVIRRGTTVRYYEEYDVETTTIDQVGTVSNLVPTGSPEELELGVALSVVPNVGNDAKKIVLALNSEISILESFKEFATGGNGGSAQLPQTSENELQTTVVVESGETVVLGGMIENKKEESEKKVPFLGDIPLIGWLFKYKKESDTPRHLIVFVTASLVQPSGEFLEVADE